MPKNETKKRQLIARYDDDLARIRKAEREYDARRKYLLGNLVLVLGKRRPKAAAQIIQEAKKLASRDHDKAELEQLAEGRKARSRIILLGALLVDYAARAPSDRRVFDMLRPLARPADRDLLADVFEHHEPYRTGLAVLDTPEEAAARNAEKAERLKDAVRMAAMRKAARDGFLLPAGGEDDDEDDPGTQRVPGKPRDDRGIER